MYFNDDCFKKVIERNERIVTLKEFIENSKKTIQGDTIQICKPNSSGIRAKFLNNDITFDLQSEVKITLENFVKKCENKIEN